MTAQSQRAKGALAAAAFTTLLLTSAAVHGQDRDLDDLKIRLERLEQRNETLERQNERLETQNQKLEQQFDRLQRSSNEGPRPVSSNAPQLNGTLETDQLEKAVENYLNTRDSQKKKEEELKKKEADERGHVVGGDLAFKTFWKDGFVAETANKDFRVHFGGRAHVDAGWFDPDENLQSLAGPAGWLDGADFRRLRLRADGTMYEVLDWVVEMDFQSAVAGTTNHPVPTDAYLSITHLPLVGALDIGHYKEPFSFDDYGTADNYTQLMERSDADNAFSPSRNLGLMLHNTACDNKLIWATGIFRANSENASGSAFDYGNGEYAYTTRVVYLPYYASEGRYWFAIGGAHSYRTLDPDDTSSRFRFRSQIPIRVGSPNFVDTGLLQADHDQLLNFQAALVLGSFMLQSEWYNAQVEDIRRGLLASGKSRTLDATLGGFYLQASYLFTGEYHPIDRERARMNRVRPNETFFCVSQGDSSCWSNLIHGRGAWEAVVRYGYLDVGSSAFRAFPAVPGIPGSGAAAVATAGIEQDIVFGLNWYLSPNVRLMANYVHAFRDVPGVSGDGDVDAIGLRAIFDF
jgi:phosphate-selective porin OprO and OprP